MVGTVGWQKFVQVFVVYFCLPGSYRLQELMCNVAIHEGAEAEGGGHPPSPRQHLQSTVPSVTQGSPDLAVPMMPTHPIPCTVSQAQPTWLLP